MGARSRGRARRGGARAPVAAADPPWIGRGNELVRCEGDPARVRQGLVLSVIGMPDCGDLKEEARSLEVTLWEGVPTAPEESDPGGEGKRAAGEVIVDDEGDLGGVPFPGPRILLSAGHRLRLWNLTFLRQREEWAVAPGARPGERAGQGFATLGGRLYLVMSYRRVSLPSPAGAGTMSSEGSRMEVAHDGQAASASSEVAEKHFWIADGFSGDLACVSFLMKREGSEIGVFKQSRIVKREEGEAARLTAADLKSERKREAP